MASELLSQRRGHALVLTISDPATRNTLSLRQARAALQLKAARAAAAYWS